MKSKVLICAFLILILAMDARAQKISAGIIAKGGVSSISYPADASGFADFHNRLQLSIQAGGFAEYKISPHSSIYVEGSYLLQQSKWHTKLTFTDVNGNFSGYGIDDFTTHLSYLTLPVCFLYHLQKFSIKGGLQGGFLIHEHATERGSGQDGASTINFTNEYSDLNIKSFDWGIVAGVQFEITSFLLVNANAYHGIANMTQENASHNTRRNFNASIGIGYRIVQFAKPE